jgi:hypothetical protein
MKCLSTINKEKILKASIFLSCFQKHRTKFSCETRYHNKLELHLQNSKEKQDKAARFSESLELKNFFLKAFLTIYSGNKKRKYEIQEAGLDKEITNS